MSRIPHIREWKMLNWAVQHKQYESHERGFGRSSAARREIRNSLYIVLWNRLKIRALYSVIVTKMLKMLWTTKLYTACWYFCAYILFTDNSCFLYLLSDIQMIWLRMSLTWWRSCWSRSVCRNRMRGDFRSFPPRSMNGIGKVQRQCSAVPQGQPEITCPSLHSAQMGCPQPEATTHIHTHTQRWSEYSSFVVNFVVHLITTKPCVNKVVSAVR